VCIVYAEYKLPKWTEYSEENCLFYINGTKSEETMVLPLLQFEYQIGVFLSYETGEKNDNTTIHLSLTGNECEKSKYFDGKTCVGSTEVAKNANFTGDFAPGDTLFWTYMAGPGLSHLTLSMKEVVGAAAISADESQILARYAGGTAAGHDMMDKWNGTLTVIAPRQGLWVFSVHLASGAKAGKADFQLSEGVCGPNSAGAGCVIPVKQAHDNMTLVISGNEWMYLRFTVDETHALLVSVTTNNGSNIPFLYAVNGQIPVMNADGQVLADIHNCNRDYCSKVRSIVRNITAPGLGAAEYWYIGIYSNVPGNTTFGLWWNNTCVPGCDTDNHGECEDNGRCQCEIDFEGIDCSVSKGLGPQYIVLIIIASLVVASAIIGFVAWAYMRRKRANYEIVS
jgi:hypothetical protein